MKKFKACGLGLRREFILNILSCQSLPNWFEIVPENWFYIPNRYRETFEKIANKHTLVAHGLSLSIGSFEKLNKKYVKELKEFLDRYNIETYSEHLSFSSLDGNQTYELLPIPMTEKSAIFISDKLKKAQDILKREVIMENPTYYYSPYSEMREIDFTNLILEKSQTKLLLDINNVFVNSLNHKFNPEEFISEIDSDKISYIHIAGHQKYDDVIIDTHGAKVNNNVWDLLEFTYSKVGLKPTLLERDNNIPPLEILMKEYNKMRDIYEKNRI